MPEIKLIDTSFRDGVQSLWAMNLRTDDMVPALSGVRDAGFDQIEVMAPGGAFKKFVRHLGENPWDYVHAMVDIIGPEHLRWHGRFQGYALSGGIPVEVGRLMIRHVVDLGIKFTRIGDNWNRIDVVADEKKTLEALGMTPIVNLMYSVSDRHTDEYFVDRARQLAAIRPYRICFKDVGGLLTPERTRKLLNSMMAVTGSIPWELHAHSNNGLAPLNALVAAECGVEFIHTSIPPLANGNSQPSVTTVSQNLQERGHEVNIDLSALEATTRHLTSVAKKNSFPIGQPHEFSLAMYRHQVPGGMISNLAHQLTMVGMGDRLAETLKEAERVRSDFGNPIMVTPLSQFVGSQAAINVIVGKRYSQVSDDVIDYALGRHGGQEAIDGMDPEVRAKILDRPRAVELELNSPVEVSLDSYRQRYGSEVSDEELILRAIVGDDAMDVIERGAEPAMGGKSPVVELLKAKVESGNLEGSLLVNTPDFQLQVHGAERNG